MAERAEPLLTEGLAMRRKLLGDEHPDVAFGLEAMGLLRRDIGDHDSALEYLRGALDMRIRVFGEDHPTVASTRAHLEDLLASREAESRR